MRFVIAGSGNHALKRFCRGSSLVELEFEELGVCGSIPHRGTTMEKQEKQDMDKLKVELIVDIFKTLPRTHQDAILGYLGLKRK